LSEGEEGELVDREATDAFEPEHFEVRESREKGEGKIAGSILSFGVGEFVPLVRDGVRRDLQFFDAVVGEDGEEGVDLAVRFAVLARETDPQTGEAGDVEREERDSAAEGGDIRSEVNWRCWIRKTRSVEGCLIEDVVEFEEKLPSRAALAVERLHPRNKDFMLVLVAGEANGE
jgi:hypothetical protein